STAAVDAHDGAGLHGEHGFLRGRETAEHGVLRRERDVIIERHVHRPGGRREGEAAERELGEAWTGKSAGARRARRRERDGSHSGTIGAFASSRPRATSGVIRRQKERGDQAALAPGSTGKIRTAA